MGAELWGVEHRLTHRTKHSFDAVGALEIPALEGCVEVVAFDRRTEVIDVHELDLIVLVRLIVDQRLEVDDHSERIHNPVPRFGGVRVAIDVLVRAELDEGSRRRREIELFEQLTRAGFCEGLANIVKSGREAPAIACRAYSWTAVNQKHFTFAIDAQHLHSGTGDGFCCLFPIWCSHWVLFRLVVVFWGDSIEPMLLAGKMHHIF